jgi:PTH1 family peptidyl-tRNA hydrolase
MMYDTFVFMKPSFLVVGLGNPGKQYALTRHNAGWLALDDAAKAFEAGEFEDKQKFLCTISEAIVDGVAILLVKPTTFMNRSGECIRKLLDFYKLDAASQLLVTCDDIDLPLGTSRLRMSGGPGTHNGLKSVVECIGEGFPRHRIGLGPKPMEMDLAAWVLSKMQPEDLVNLHPGLTALVSSFQEVQKQRA